MQAQVLLTVAQGKRLIAKGILKHPDVERVLGRGMLAISKGTTNSYIVEEILKAGFDKRQYVTGHTLPPGVSSAGVSSKHPDVVLKDGRAMEGLSVADAVKQMGPGDVFLKGANCINYAAGKAGVLIGHPTGGTMGAALGAIISKRIKLIVPVGLEKEIGQDVEEAAARLASAAQGSAPALWPLAAELFTEIEALSMLCPVEAFEVAAGGIGGAEGAIRLAVEGDDEDVERATALVESLRGEPPFLGRVE